MQKQTKNIIVGLHDKYQNTKRNIL